MKESNIIGNFRLVGDFQSRMEKWARITDTDILRLAMKVATIEEMMKRVPKPMDKIVKKWHERAFKKVQGDFFPNRKGE